jgi:hypothetical protein
MSRIMRSLIIAAIAAALILPASAFAHEHRDVEGYEFTVGFINEPAFVNEQNGIWLRILNHDTGEPIEGLADTLQAQVIKGDQTRDLELRPAWGEQGVYISEFYPTEPGDYTFRFVGEINGTPVDESFTSSPGGFDSVAEVTDLQFPAAVPTNAALSEQLAAAQNTARLAMIAGGLGALLGLSGLVVAALALRGRNATTRRESPVASAR